MKWSLLDNGVDFIRSGIESFILKETKDARDYKYALLHLFSGTLLILKERLRREHPSLVFTKVTEDRETVDFAEVQARLAKCAGIALSEADTKILKRAQKLRNSIEHYEFDLNLHYADSVIAELTVFLESFLGNHLGASLEGKLPFTVWRRLLRLKDVVQARRDSWPTRAAQFQNVSDQFLRDLAAPVYEHKIGFESPSLLECIECSSDSVAVMTDSDIGLCTRLECRAVTELTWCRTCHSPSVSDLCPPHRLEDDAMWESAYDAAVAQQSKKERS
ncbi:MAG: hypothetical protein DI536_13250 [Archangium gephyra]|uniref:DUF4145 domain-containing protein n=1 Tax=Archangium gephyra TaxID=48 RepID=A0A2W5THG2_9BACT|nr:MAG: hypothetical protein DI536_13250 [Archangium gephyra]